MAVNITADLTAVRARLAELRAQGSDLTPAFKVIGRVLLSRIRLGFRTGTAPKGTPWRALRSRVGQPLRDTGRLQSSIRSQADRDGVTIGTNLIYARVHQFGATIVPRQAKMLAFEIGGRTVFAKSVTIPARPYMPLTPAGQIDLPPAWAAGILRELSRHLGLQGATV